MKILRLNVCKQATVIGALALCLSLFLASPSLEAQSPKSSSLSQTRDSITDVGVYSLQQLSSSLETLSKTVSLSVVQIFSTGYDQGNDRELGTTDLLSRGSSWDRASSLPPMVGS
jgi:hypothetical protein